MAAIGSFADVVAIPAQASTGVNAQAVIGVNAQASIGVNAHASIGVNAPPFPANIIIIVVLLLEEVEASDSKDGQVVLVPAFTLAFAMVMIIMILDVMVTNVMVTSVMVTTVMVFSIVMINRIVWVIVQLAVMVPLLDFMLVPDVPV